MDALAQNKAKYEKAYREQREFLRYPADWVIRFHNMYMKQHIPSGKVLDFGCGSGNNSRFFMDKGYEVYGTDVADAALPLIEQNCGSTDNFQILPPDISILPFENGAFDFILSNQVLYYYDTAERIRAICEELKRCLKPSGVVFFTMMGPKSYYITKHAERVGDDLYEVKIGTGHRLSGYHEIIYVVRDQAHLLDLFDTFDCLTTGYFDQSMFDLESNFHWIFVGQKYAHAPHP